MPITIENYEAFYLDYLEGNLSGETLVAFEAFLAAHPELSVDDELVMLQPAEESFDPMQKLALKQGIDMDDLNAETIEFFLIARQEGLLSAEQNAHLNHWLEANAHYQQDARLYALTTFKADETVVYEGKADLKKPVGGGRVIPLWFTGLAVAAGLALLFTIGMNQDENGTGSKKPAQTESIASTGRDTVKHNDQASTSGDRHKVKNTNGKQVNDNHKQPVNDGKKGNGSQPNTPKRPVYQHSILHEGTVLASLEKRQAKLSASGDKTISPLVTPKPIQVVPEEVPANDVALVTVDEMKNPIKPVTNRLSETFNTPIDFRTAKAAKKKGGGYYFKIGKWEVTHQTASL